MIVAKVPTHPFYTHYEQIEDALHSYTTARVIGKMTPYLFRVITSYVMEVPTDSLSHHSFKEESITVFGFLEEKNKAYITKYFSGECFQSSLIDQQDQLVSLAQYVPLIDSLKPEYIVLSVNYIEAHFSQSGVFSVCLVWGYTVYTLLKEVLPNEYEKWPRLFFALKLCCYEKSSGGCSEVERGELDDVKNQLEELLALSKKKWLEEPDNRKKKALFCLLCTYKNMVIADHALFPKRFGVSKQIEYVKILDFIHFVQKMYQNHHAQLKWQKFFPEKIEHFFSQMSEWYPKLLRSYASLRFTLLLKKVALKAQRKGVICRNLNVKGELSDSKKIETMHLLFTDSTLCIETVVHLYTALFMPFLHFFNQENDIPDLTGVIQKKAKDLAGLLQKKPRITQKMTLAIGAVAQKIPSRKTLSSELFNLLTRMNTNLERAPQTVFPLLLPKTEEAMSISFLALNSGEILSLFALFQNSLQNIDSSLAKLFAFLNANLRTFEAFLERFDLDFLREHGDDLVEIAEEIHLHASTTLLASIDFMFALGSIEKGAPAIFGENDTFLPPTEEVRPLSFFVAFVGGKHSLRKVISRKEEALVPVVKAPEPKMFIQPPSASSSSFSPSVPSFAAGKPSTTLPHKKVKKKSSIPSLSSAAPLMTGAKKEKSVVQDVLPHSKEVIALKKKLHEMGFEYLRGSKRKHAVHEDVKRDARHWQRALNRSTVQGTPSKKSSTTLASTPSK